MIRGRTRTGTQCGIHRSGEARTTEHRCARQPLAPQAPLATSARAGTDSLDPTVALDASDLTLLNRVFDYNGKRFTAQELQQIADKIQARIDEHGGEPDEFGSLLDLDFFQLWDDERPAIRRRLIADAQKTAIELCRSGGFSPDITLVVIRICADDPDWAFDYAKYVGADIFADENDRKNEINPIMARRIREAFGGQVAETKNGTRQIAQVTSVRLKIE